MTEPTAGPFTQVLQLPGPPTPLGFVPTWLYRAKTWYRQKKPYDLPLEFESRLAAVTKLDRTYPDWNGTVQAYTTGTDPQIAYFGLATNKAMGELKEACGEESLWAVNIHERQQAMSLITDDALILWKFARKLNRFDFPGAARVLKTHMPKGLKATAKSFGNNFLKFHFGWEPLIQDIGAAVDVLQSPIPSKVVKGKGTIRSASVMWQDSNGNPITWPLVWTRCRVQCRVTPISENLYKANQLGFVNPLTVAWELVPFSFVVDWFGNVGQFLAQHTDMAGLQITEAFTTIYQSADRGSSTWFLPGLGTIYTAKYIMMYTKRSRGLPTIELRIRPWKGVSPVRAATAISLLVQQLR